MKVIRMKNRRLQSQESTLEQLIIEMWRQLGHERDRLVVNERLAELDSLYKKLDNFKQKEGA